MAETKTTNEITRSLDGTEFVRLATSGANWKATVSAIKTFIVGTFTGLANPTASVGTVAVNGTATTAMRSDAAPALDVTISPTWTGTHVFNKNTASAPANAGGDVLQVVAADGNVSRLEADAFGQIAAVTVRRANNTNASKTALASGDQIGAFNYHGYYVTGGPAYSGVQASVQGMATQNWTSTALGTKVVISTTPNGSTTLTTAATFDQDGSLTTVGEISSLSATLNPGASASALTLTGGTVTTSQPLINATQTWNAAGVTFDGLVFNTTATAYTAPGNNTDSGSRLLNLKVGGTTVAQINSQGRLAVTPKGGLGGSFFPSIGWIGGGVAGFDFDTTRSAVYYTQAGAGAVIGFQSGGLQLQSAGVLSFSGTGDALAALKTAITSPAATVLQLGAAAADTTGVNQTLQAQGVTTGGTNNQQGGNLTISSGQGKGNVASSLIFQTPAVGASGNTLQTMTTVLQLSVTSGGNQIVALGGATSSFPALKRSGTTIAVRLADETGDAPLTAATLTATSGNIQTSAGDAFKINGRLHIFSPSDGVMKILNGAATDFGRLNFGGDTSSFPALKRSTATLQARLADDSAFALLQGKITTDTAYVATPQVPTGYIVIYDSTGTAYKVPANL